MITDMKDAKIFQPLQLGRTTLKKNCNGSNEHAL